MVNKIKKQIISIMFLAVLLVLGMRFVSADCYRPVCYDVNGNFIYTCVIETVCNTCPECLCTDADNDTVDACDASGNPKYGCDNPCDCNDTNLDTWQKFNGYLDDDRDGFTLGGLQTRCVGAIMTFGGRRYGLDSFWWTPDKLGEDCDDTNPNIWQLVSNLYQDNDQDGCTVGGAQTVCVGNPTLKDGRTYYYNGLWWLLGSGFGNDSDDNDNTKCVPSNTSNCLLTSAYWNTTKGKQGEKVKLIVNGTNCNGINVRFIVKENDSTSTNVITQPVNANFVNNQSITNWTAEWQDDSDEGGDNNPEYYFNASLVLNSSKSIISGLQDSKLLHVNKTTIPANGTITAMYWENTRGEKINKSDLKDNVYAVVEGLASGQNVEYKIWGIGCGILGLDCAAVSGSFTSVGSKNLISWKAGNMTTDFSEGFFYIEARINGVGSWNSTKGIHPYGELNVSAENNNRPNANITSPKDKQIYFLNEQLNFSAVMGDDDNFNYTWDLGDGTIKAGNSSNLLNYNFFYAYSTTGQKNIILSVNDERGEISRYVVSILVVNSSYILAYIDEPKWGEMIYRKVIKFNASSSYVVNLTRNSTGIKKIDCIAGPCPSKTEGCLPPNTNYPACQIPILGIIPNWVGFENINFSWVFDDGSMKNKKGMAGAVFNKTFRVPGYHWGILNASINPNAAIRTEFSNRFGPYCDREHYPIGMWDFVNGDFVFINYTSPVYNCSKNNSGCCPIDLSLCNKTSGKCEAGPILCENFTTPAECAADNNHETIAYDSLNELLKKEGYFCGYIGFVDDCEESVNCLCKWNGTACLPDAEYTLCSNKKDCYFDISTIGDCSQTSSVLLSWVVDWRGTGAQPAYCADGQKSSPCPAQLDFISEISMIIAILLISMIYLRKRWKIQMKTLESANF